MHLLLPLIAFAGQAEFYVAPDGSDSNPGTLQQPFKSLAKTKDTVATLIPSMTEDITVFFKGGNYFFNDVVKFTLADGANNSKEALIYPNPVSKHLKIADAAGSGSTVGLYNILRKLVSVTHINSTEQTIDFSQLAEGYYLVKAIKANGNIETFKVIKN